MDSPWFIIADDFTGSGDSAVQFRTPNRPARFLLDLNQKNLSGLELSAYVVNSDSRFLSGAEAYKRVRGIAKAIGESACGKLFKKIDSTLRGNIAEEVAAVMDGAGFSRALVCPAAPRNGRTVVDGLCLVNQKPINSGTVARDHFTPVDEACLASHFESKFPGRIAHISLQELRDGAQALATAVERLSEEGKTIFTADAQSIEDLELLATLAELPGLLLVGSSGLAEALANHKAASRTEVSPQGIQKVPVEKAVFFVGSVTPTSAAQCAFLAASGSVQRIVVDGRGAADEPAAEMARVLAEAEALPDAALLFNTSSVKKGVSAEQARLIGARISQFMGELALEVARRRSARFLFAMGGDTAARIVASLGADYIDFTDEILPGLPYGSCQSRALGISLNFACKSGGFGAMDALVQVLDRVSGTLPQAKAASEQRLSAEEYSAAEEPSTPAMKEIHS
ncbi:MAG: four-carbon acid sugar kinase family protein [Spirochaetia bacterium]|nr:four-carbon acid sugar kinase family protein [Spirochaetia bacterium]